MWKSFFMLTSLIVRCEISRVLLGRYRSNSKAQTFQNSSIIESSKKRIWERLRWSRAECYQVVFQSWVGNLSGSIAASRWTNLVFCAGNQSFFHFQSCFQFPSPLVRLSSFCGIVQWGASSSSARPTRKSSGQGHQSFILATGLLRRLSLTLLSVNRRQTTALSCEMNDLGCASIYTIHENTVWMILNTSACTTRTGRQSWVKDAPSGDHMM